MALRSSLTQLAGYINTQAQVHCQVCCQRQENKVPSQFPMGFNHLECAPPQVTQSFFVSCLSRTLVRAFSLRANAIYCFYSSSNVFLFQVEAAPK